MIKNKVVKNASWIIASRIVQALLGLVISMLTARYLGPSNFGLINYAASIVTFVVPIAQLGLSNTLVQELVNSPEEEGKILGTTFVATMFSSLACVVGVISFAMIANKDERTTIIVCALYSVSLIFQAMEITQYWFQSKYYSKYTSIIATVAYFIISGYKIYLLATEKSIYWFALSYALDYLIIAVAMFVVYKCLGGQRLQFSFDLLRKMFNRSKHYIFSSLMIRVFAETDKIMLKLMMGDAETGFYSAAVHCAGITSFVFAAIIDSMRPLILEKYKESKEIFEKNTSRLFGIIIYLSLIQSIGMTAFANLIIYILYGSEYMAATPMLQLIVWYTTFSYLGSARNVWVLAEGKQKYLWILNMSGAILNVVMNLALIPVMGGMGAALASLVTQFFANVIMVIILKPYRRSAFLMLKGLNIKDLVRLIRRK